MPKPNTAATEPACEKANAATADTGKEHAQRLPAAPDLHQPCGQEVSRQLRDGDGQRIAERLGQRAKLVGQQRRHPCERSIVGEVHEEPRGPNGCGARDALFAEQFAGVDLRQWFALRGSHWLDATCLFEIAYGLFGFVLTPLGIPGIARIPEYEHASQWHTAAATRQ